MSEAEKKQAKKIVESIMYSLSSDAKLLDEGIEKIISFSEAYHQRQSQWISVEDELPEYTTEDAPAFSLFIEASNNRFYTGYSVTEYGTTTFYQHNGRKILNVLAWKYAPTRST